MSGGRLALYPRVDDVIYLARGAVMYREWMTGGLSALARDYAAKPPHAPVSALLTALAFRVGGVRELAAYGTSALQVLVMLGAAAWVTRRMGVVARACVVVFVASVPLLADGVHTYKPDYLCGILTAIGVLIGLRPTREPGRGKGLRVSLAAGAVFGLALLAKPSIFPLTLGLLVGTAGLRVLGSWVCRRRAAWSSGVRAGAAMVIGVLVVAGPHAWLAGRAEWAYFSKTMFGSDKHLWTYSAGIFEHALFHLTGPGGRIMLGAHVWAIFGLAAWGFVRIVRERRRATIVHGASVGIVLVVAYLAPAINTMKILTFATAFQSLFVLAGVKSLAHVWHRARVRAAPGRFRTCGVRAAGVVAIGLGVFGVLSTGAWAIGRTSPLFVRSGIPHGSRPNPAVVESVYGAVRSASAGLTRKTVRVVILGGPGEINANLLTLWSVRNGARWSVRHIRRVLSDVEFERAMKLADVVVINNGLTDLVVGRRTAPGLAEQTQDRLRKDGSMVMNERIGIPNSAGTFEVYRRAGPNAGSGSP